MTEAKEPVATQKTLKSDMKGIWQPPTFSNIKSWTDPKATLFGGWRIGSIAEACALFAPGLECCDIQDQFSIR